MFQKEIARLENYKKKKALKKKSKADADQPAVALDGSEGSSPKSVGKKRGSKESSVGSSPKSVGKKRGSKGSSDGGSVEPIGSESPEKTPEKTPPPPPPPASQPPPEKPVMPILPTEAVTWDPSKVLKDGDEKKVLGMAGRHKGCFLYYTNEGQYPFPPDVIESAVRHVLFGCFSRGIDCV